MILFIPSDIFENAKVQGTDSREGLGEGVRRVCHELLTKLQYPRCASAGRHTIEIIATPLTLNRPGDRIDPVSWEK